LTGKAILYGTAIRPTISSQIHGVKVSPTDVTVELPYVTLELPHVTVECVHATLEHPHVTVEYAHARVELAHVTVEYAHVKPPSNTITNNFNTAILLGD